MIFLDLIMSDMTGFEVLERLKSDDATKGIPVILNTSAILSEEDAGGSPPGLRRSFPSPPCQRRRRS